MSISDGSSATDRTAPPRSRFALTGPSVALDPRTHAVRGDLADIELAAQVFAPHYAKATNCHALRDVDVRARPDGDEVVATLAADEVFHVLDLSGGIAWGRTEAGLVGYIPGDALVCRW